MFFLVGVFFLVDFFGELSKGALFITNQRDSGSPPPLEVNIPVKELLLRHEL